MNLAFESDPPYSRSQIVGLLAGAQNFGAVQGVATTSNSGNGNGITTLAEGQLNTVFTRSLLEPLSTALGGAFGLDNVQLTNDMTGGFGANVRKGFGHAFTATFAESFGQPCRESLTLETIAENKPISLRTVFYSQEQATFFGETNQEATGLNINAPNMVSIQPMSGTNGFDFLLTRKWP
jgi:hypothetical protein